MQALLIGATGATGKDLLDLLLKDDAFHQVDIFIRSVVFLGFRSFKSCKVALSLLLTMSIF